MLVFAGEVQPGGSVKDETEQWDGTSWTEVADLSSTIYDHGGSGTAALALSFAGRPPTTAATEEWTLAHTLKKVTLG